MLQFASFSFDAAIEQIFPALICGATVVLRSQAMWAPAEFQSKLEELGLTVINLPTAYWHHLVDEWMGLPNLTAPLRLVIAGGEEMRAQSLELWRRTSLNNVHLINAYGPTETTITATSFEIPPATPRLEFLGRISIGRSRGERVLYVLDQWGFLVPPGVPGELYIGGPLLARAYHNSPDLTAEKFIPDPFSGEAGGRLYKTGDLGRYLADGNIEFLGRLDDQVKIRGYRIELGEIENVIRGYEGVGEAVVVAREDEPGQKRLVGYVVWRGGHEGSVGELRGYLQGKLPEYMVPGLFVVMDKLPLTANGKLDRKALPRPEGRAAEVEYVEPRKVEEETLVEIWKSVLKLERVGIHDNFFELGGDSILSIQIVARANGAGLKLTPRQLFERQTIAGLAEVIGQAGMKLAAQGTISGPVELTPIQRWFFEQELAEAHHFNQSVMLEVKAGLDWELIVKVMREIVRQHDALRMRYELAEGRWRQVNAAVQEENFYERVDLSAVTEVQQNERIRAEANHAQKGLNLEAGPLMRVVWFEMGSGKAARLLLVIHHLCVDGVSWRILLEDLQQGCAQALRGETIEFGAKTSSYQQWAGRGNETAQSAEMEKELDYWVRVSQREKKALPVDVEGGENSVASASYVAVGLKEEETRALLQEVPEKYHTHINDELLTALAQAFQEWTGERELMVDMEGHGREELFEELDVTRTVGWFTTVYPVMLELGRGMGVAEALKAVKEQLRVVPHRGIGYGILKYLRGAVELQAAGVAEVSFNYLGQLDQVLEEGGMFGAARESAGAQHSGRNRRQYRLEVSGWVSGGQLRLGLRYSENLHQRGTVEKLGEGIILALRNIIIHCQSESAGDFTPSDFPLARLTQSELDGITARVREIEDIYALSPLQEGLLFPYFGSVWCGNVFFTIYLRFGRKA